MVVNGQITGWKSPESLIGLALKKSKGYDIK